MPDIAVIGGGASGIMAAITAAGLGCSVKICEKNDRTMKKLLATGNGRCNLTNKNITIDRYHGEIPEFPKTVLEKFTKDNTMELFYEMGLLCREEEDKIFPYSLRASSVIDILRLELDRLGVEVECSFDVKEIIPRKSVYEIVSWDGRHEFATAVIFSCGGKAAPSLGGGSSGYEILKKLGYNVTTLKPSIVQIKTETEAISGLKGVKAMANVSLGGKTEYGELLFTEYGISGPPAFSLSSYYGGEAVEIDFFPEIDKKDLFLLLKQKADLGLTGQELFTGLIHKNIALAIIKKAGVDTKNVTASALNAICEISKKFTLKTEGTMSWNNAQVTRGGISTAQVKEDTLESKKHPGLYITGEVLDVDGDCGGFNLQWAWSSGHVAGEAAAIKILKG